MDRPRNAIFVFFYAETIDGSSFWPIFITGRNLPSQGKSMGVCFDEYREAPIILGGSLPKSFFDYIGCLGSVPIRRRRLG